ncbi:MAG: dTMP kinase [candidate division KSB1 bacterium]|nr:dTMP kinase [candidate division KSB1 bacterium]
MKGFLITFEGIDFSGKSTQAQLLAQKLQAKNYPLLLLRDPGATPLSEKIRELLLDATYSGMGAETELFLFSAARAQMVREKIIPGLKEGKIIICERFYDSTTAYQGFGRQLPLEIVQKINEIAAGEVCPDLTFLLDLDPELALERKIRSGGHWDRMEKQELDFIKRVREGYLKIAQWEPQRIVVVKGEKFIAELENEIWNYVSEKLKL